ncbi:benenodin family lasso peptide [Stenotrophomonas mori]|uniref:Benenodin family lasso peptide n=1 Tax=Stenotrophomonas mori TaxID=2871096 RepID=A0ABT0SI11_9GAMM|nr:benenodin family lasso peptide [Stenotrophomonas mori]MCL7714976.1 benenodin family lasso peptide [Stenotrophomonas mori]
MNSTESTVRHDADAVIELGVASVETKGGIPGNTEFLAVKQDMGISQD